MDDMYIKKAKRVVSTCMIEAPLNLGAELLRGGVPMDACGLHRGCVFLCSFHHRYHHRHRLQPLRMKVCIQ
jgi:hypothetical protein